jgi:hypothetical protein
MLNSRKILPALAIFAMLGTGYTGSAQAAATDAGYLDFMGSSSYNTGLPDNGNLYQGGTQNYVSGYRAPSHGTPGIHTAPTSYQYNIDINQSAAHDQAFNTGANASTGYIAPGNTYNSSAASAGIANTVDLYNDQFFVGYEYHGHGDYGNAVYQYSDGTQTYNSYFDPNHYQSFAQGTIQHNETITQQAMGNAIIPTENTYDYNTMDWAGMASSASGAISSGASDYVSDYAGNYANDLFDNIDISFGSSNSGSSNSSSGGISQYLSFGGSDNANGVKTSSMSFGTPLAAPVADLALTGQASPSFAPTLNALGSISGLGQMSDFYKSFGSASFLDKLPGGMGGNVKSMLNDASDKIGDAAVDAGSEFFSSMSDSFDDFSMDDIGFGDFSFDDFSMGDMGFGDFDMGSMFEGFDIGSLDFVGDFDLGSLTDGLDLDGMFGGMMDGFDIGSIFDTSALTGEISSMISEELSGMLGDMIGDFLGDFDIGGAIGGFLG